MSSQYNNANFQPLDDLQPALDFLEVATKEVSADVYDHGVALDEQKKKVKCNYCGKVVSGFGRLRYHLGGVRGDVAPCEEVLTDVKELIRNKLLETKRGNLGKEVGELYHPNLPWKRNWSPQLNVHNKLETTQAAGSVSIKCTKENSLSENSEKQSVLFPKRKVSYQVTMNGIDYSSPQEAQKCIGRFFYENDIDFCVAKSPSFQKMINATVACGKTEYKIPISDGLKGHMLKDEVKEMQQYVREIRNSWTRTGCSIILDGWNDEKGRHLLNILVDCPQGPIYLRSVDISASVGDVDALCLFFDDVIQEVGIENVVQIITYSASASMERVGKQLMEKHRTFFWTVSASHCIGLMLEKMGTMDLIKEILEKAKTITRFIYSHGAVLKLMRYHTNGCDLVKPSKIRAAMPFLALENIVSEKRNLKKMFVSSQWNTSILASSKEGKIVAGLVADRSFWSGTTKVLKATIPLVRVLDLIDEDDKPQLGYIYETIDQAKETIKEEFKNKKARYMPFWSAIDEIWNRHLHSPLHSAGYFLNPSLFYSSDFFTDPEVASGLLCCIVHMTEDKCIQDLVIPQVDEYRGAKGAFGHGSAVDRRSDIPPAVWWSQYGGQCPELQRIAVRILSQPCNGASKYQLKRSLAEKLLTKGRNCIEQQRLHDLAFVHYNLQLQNFKLGVNRNTVVAEIDSMDEWIVEEAQESLYQNDEAMWMDLDSGDATASDMAADVEGPTAFYPKEE